MGTDGAARSHPRAAAIGAGLSWSARWSLRLALVALGLTIVGWVIGQFWSVVLPVVLALALTTVLRPPAAWLMARRWPPAAAASSVVGGAFAVVVGIGLLIAPAVVGQLGAITQSVVGGLGELRTSLAGPPLNLGEGQVGVLLDQVTQQLQQSTASIAVTVLTGVSSVVSLLGTALVALVLVFLFVKDGARFLPWLGRWAGFPAVPHLAAVLSRAWVTLGAFVRTQALVGLIDGTLIGVGLAILGVPLAVPLALLTFVAAFIPYLGAILAGALAVLVALFTQGFTSAIVALVIVLIVQQLEGNVIAPVLQGQSLGLHPAVILLAVIGGWSLYGVTGALLAVPVAAVVATVMNYLREQVDARGRDDDAPEPSADETRDGTGTEAPTG